MNTPLSENVRELWQDYRPTRLIDLSALARRAKVARVLVKVEAERPLGNFKVLGGMGAGLRALARMDAARASGRPVPRRLICASDGNHGLAVAAAARKANAFARIYLADGVSRARVARIEAQGAEIIRVAGTYDDAVNAASAAAAQGEGLLIADTSADPNDRIVKDVMAGYGLISRELRLQLDDDIANQPSHMFIQAGVGGLAAAMAEGLRSFMREPAKLLVVEPQSAACVAAALAAGRPVRIPGDLHTAAEMLSCGLASASALEILRAHDARSVVVGDEQLRTAMRLLRDAGGPDTTPSGAAGLAGLLHVAASAELRAEHEIDSGSSVVLIVTEGPISTE